MDFALGVLFYFMFGIIVEKIITNSITNLKNAFKANNKGFQSSGRYTIQVFMNGVILYILIIYISQIWYCYRFNIDFIEAWNILKNIINSTFGYF